MEGVLYKWTNYISGWQPRWFVLDGGTLSYYDSQEDAWKGCKGSIKIAVCEIQVHPSDFTRVDLTIPGEQYFYLRAINAAERQKWLVALGTAKACFTDNRTKREKELQDNTEALKTKMSELRLYCDLLLQQVNKIKEGSSSQECTDSFDGEGDSSSLVKSTCTTFLKTLEECMQIASQTFSPDLLNPSPPGSPQVSAVRPQKIKPLTQSSQNFGVKQKESARSVNVLLPEGEADLRPEKAEPPGFSPKIIQAPASGISPLTEEEEQIESMSQEGSKATLPQNTNHTVDVEIDDKSENNNEHKIEKETEHGQEKQEGNTACEHEEQKALVPDQKGVGQEGKTSQPEGQLEDPESVETFFSSMSHRFSDITLDDDSGIPTQAFLDSCYAIVPVLDKLGPTVFAPVKIDFVGNIKKIHQKLVSDPESFPTLQTIVLHEVKTDVAQVRNSATEALLWLKRGLKFLKEFLSEVNAGERDIHGALNSAYGKTLRQYHGWVVRGVFALALRAAPSYGAFTAALVTHEGDEMKDGFTTGMHRDLDVYLPAMERQLSILDALYEEYGLESDEVV
ncbi:pleckstrin homology domain-containing family A member 8 [Denticeps clupeoides]|uniref:Pleckstrin homology domain-containing family A member 8 n=1 Tax=Denticeps clupeoides TaxID=299321 RepID=A0AAY4A2U2_9TELE|nr:pleckstrin homology domain-containing family A member 8 [Denticeps clupeoides]